MIMKESEKQSELKCHWGETGGDGGTDLPDPSSLPPSPPLLAGEGGGGGAGGRMWSQPGLLQGAARWTVPLPSQGCGCGNTAVEGLQVGDTRMKVKEETMVFSWFMRCDLTPGPCAGWLRGRGEHQWLATLCLASSVHTHAMRLLPGLNQTEIWIVKKKKVQLLIRYESCNWTNGYHFDTALLLSVFLGMFGADRFKLSFQSSLSLILSNILSGFTWVTLLSVCSNSQLWASSSLDTWFVNSALWPSTKV